MTRVDTIDFDSAEAQWVIRVKRHPEHTWFDYPAPRPDDFPQDLKDALIYWATPKETS
jgi:hypothetical protein